MEAHRAWRYAKAKCDEVSYAWGRSIPDSVTEPLNIAARDTLDAFLLTPAPTINALAWKLRVFRDEDIADGWHLANEIVDCLYRDAERLADRHAMEATHG